MLKKTAVSVLAAMGLALLVNCGGGDSETATDEAQGITSEQLPDLVLSLDEFGLEYAAFTPSDENGFNTIDEVAAGEDDPAAERGDLEEFGWVSEYEAFFVNPAGEDSLGVRTIGSTVHLFETSEGSAGYFADSMQELNSADTTEGSSVLRAADRFPAAVGDEAVGFVIEDGIERSDGSLVPFSARVVFFRKDRLLASVVLTAAAASDADKDKLQDDIEALATALNKGLDSVSVARLR
jgi:hypothetical protein